MVSGETIEDRPEVQKVLRRIESPSIKAILIVEVARLSRGDLEDAGRLIKLLRYTNTLVITPMKTFDLADEYDRDMFERELKRSNEILEYQRKIMQRGTDLSISLGNYVSSRAPYGYDRIFITEGKRKCPTLAINEERANVVRMIFDMYVYQNIGIYVICNKLNELNISPPKETAKYWSPSTIRDILMNVHYLGKIKQGWRKRVVTIEDGEVKKRNPRHKEYNIYEGKHPAIISEETFNLAQEKQGRNHRTKSTTVGLTNPLAGLVYCKCGRSMTLRVYRTPDGGERSSPRLLCTGQVNCNTGSCLHSEIMDFVVDLLKQKIAEFKIEASNSDDGLVKTHAQLIKNLEKKLSDIERREISMWEAQVHPDSSLHIPNHIFQTLTTKLTEERESTQKALAEARNTMPNPINYEKKVITFQMALDALLDNEVGAEEKNNLLKQCIERIEYHRDRPERLKGKGVKGQWADTPIELDVKLKV